MNFNEFVTDRREFILVDSREKPVTDASGDSYETMAISPIKAKHQILHRMRNSEKSQMEWDVIENRDNYSCILKSDWLNAEYAKRPKPPKAPPLPKKPSQGELFNIRWF